MRNTIIFETTFEVFTMVKIQIEVLWVVTPPSQGEVTLSWW